MTASRFAAALGTVAALTVPVSVSADPITITSGRIVITGSESAGAQVDIAGTQGFSFRGTIAPASGHAMGCDPCNGGDDIPLSANAGSLFGGSVTFAGRRLQTTADDTAFVEMSAGFATLPELPEDFDFGRFSFDSGFDFDGELLLQAASGGRPVNLTLRGSGNEVATFAAARQFGTSQFFITTLIFDFGSGPAPTPEPATLLLLGSGVIAVGARHRRAKTQPTTVVAG